MKWTRPIPTCWPSCCSCLMKYICNIWYWPINLTFISHHVLQKINTDCFDWEIVTICSWTMKTKYIHENIELMDSILFQIQCFLLAFYSHYHWVVNHIQHWIVSLWSVLEMVYCQQCFCHITFEDLRNHTDLIKQTFE